MYQIIFYIALFIGFFPLLVAFLMKKKEVYLKHPIIPLVILVALGTLYEFVGTKLLKINTLYWFQLYPLIEFCALYYFFLNILPECKKVLKMFLPFAVILYIVSFIYLNNESRLISLAINRSFLSIFVLFFSLIWLKNLSDKLNNISPFENVEIPNLWQSDTFYFVSGLAIYYATTFFLFLSSSLIFDSNLYFYDFWLVNVLATLIFRIFLIIGVWKMKQG